MSTPTYCKCSGRNCLVISVPKFKNHNYWHDFVMLTCDIMLSIQTTSIVSSLPEKIFNMSSKRSKIWNSRPLLEISHLMSSSATCTDHASSLMIIFLSAHNNILVKANFSNHGARKFVQMLRNVKFVLK